MQPLVTILLALAAIALIFSFISAAVGLTQRWGLPVNGRPGDPPYWRLAANTAQWDLW